MAVMMRDIYDERHLFERILKSNADTYTFISALDEIKILRQTDFFRLASTGYSFFAFLKFFIKRLAGNGVGAGLV